MTPQERRQNESDHDTRIALLEHITGSIQKQMEAMNANLAKLVWLVFAALILAVMKVVFVPGAL